MALRSQNIRYLAKSFGVSCRQIQKPKNAVLTNVFIINGSWILRGRRMVHGIKENFMNECRLIDSIRPIIPFDFPRYKESSNKKKFIVRYNIFWTCYPMIFGKEIHSWFDSYYASDADTKKIIYLVKTLHSKTQGIFQRFPDERFRFIRDINNKFRQLPGMLEVDEVRRIRLAFLRINDFLRQVSSRQCCFIHGDIHFGNVIFGKNRNTIGLIDTDWCRVGYYLEDVAYTVMMFLRSYRLSHFAFDRKKFDKLIRWFSISEEKEIFWEYLILFTLFDVNLFYGLRMKKYLRYQLSFLKTLCSMDI